MATKKAPKKAKVKKAPKKAKASKKPAKKAANGAMKMLNFKVSVAEAKTFKKIAERYTRGNVTALFRLAIPAFKPQKKIDTATIRASTR